MEEGGGGQDSSGRNQAQRAAVQIAHPGLLAPKAAAGKTRPVEQGAGYSRSRAAELSMLGERPGRGRKRGCCTPCGCCDTAPTT